MGFEAAIKIAQKYGTMGGYDETEIRTAFYVRLALCLLHEDSEVYCKKSLDVVHKFSKEKTHYYIDRLYCEPEDKAKMKALIS